MSSDKIFGYDNANWTEKALVRCTRFDVYRISWKCNFCCNSDICKELRDQERPMLTEERQMQREAIRRYMEQMLI